MRICACMRVFWRIGGGPLVWQHGSAVAAAGECLVIIAEVRDAAPGPLPVIAAAARAAVMGDHGVRPASVVLLAPRTVPKVRARGAGRVRAV